MKIRENNIILDIEMYYKNQDITEDILIAGLMDYDRINDLYIMPANSCIEYTIDFAEAWERGETEDDNQFRILEGDEALQEQIKHRYVDYRTYEIE